MSGPSPKPLALRVLHGDQRKRTNLVEPHAREVTDLEPPPWFDESSQEMWRKVADELLAMGLLKQCDTHIMATYVVAFRTFERAAEMLERTGVMVKSRDGQPVRNPLCAIQRDAMNMVRLLGRELGFSPAARTSMAQRPEGADDDLATRYLAR